MKTKFRILAALLALSLCLGLAACGGETPAGTAPSEAEATPAETAADTAPAEAPAEPEPTESPVSLPGLSWPVEEAEGPTAVSYPYIVRTETAVWHLSKDDMELLGDEAYCAGLEQMLQNANADFVEAQALLAPWLWEEIPPVDIYTDFSGHMEESRTFGAYYRGQAKDIRLFHNWNAAGQSLLHEYVHYLSFSCTDKPIIMNLWADALAEYVSCYACRNRMARTAYLAMMDPETVEEGRKYGLLDEDGCLDPARMLLFQAERIKAPENVGQKYGSISQAFIIRTERMNEHPSYTTISYPEAGAILAYLVETYGEDLVFGHWDTEPSDMEEVYGKGFEELYRDWEVWNLAKCGELGIRLDLAKADAEKAS